MPRRRSYRRPFRRRTRKRRRNVRKKTSRRGVRGRSFKAKVSAVIRSTAETKRTNQNPHDYNFNPTNTTMSQPVFLHRELQIANGQLDGQRIGEEVTVKTCKLRILLRAQATETAILQIFIGKLKENPSARPTQADLKKIFDDGLGTAEANGTMFSLMRRLNRDVFTINHYKKYKIGTAIPITGELAVPNNDFPSYRFITIDLMKVLGGKLRFESGATPSYPTNKHLFMFCNWVNPVLGLSSFPPLMKWYLDCTYTDL